MAKPDAAKTDSTELDAVDWAILGILQNDATIPNKDIAARVGIAPRACSVDLVEWGDRAVRVIG
ncbi:MULTISPECIES: AsnC family transcriptional regulator [unclassified Nocardiopsis]|uniref:AsnC family transcriptional regulator n=1 Tax=Nocardiopsis TaxID=2013 RepID=UPI00387B3245